MTRAKQLALAAKWALGVDELYWAQYSPSEQAVRFGAIAGVQFDGGVVSARIRNITPAEWQDAVLAALINIAKTARESDAVAGRIFDAANGSVTDSVGRIATVPNTQLPAPSTEGN